MGTVTVNYEGHDPGGVYEIAGVGHVVNGYANDFPDRPDSIVIGTTPAEPLPVLSEEDRMAAVIEQLERDAESYRASDTPGAEQRAAEIDALITGHRSRVDAGD